MALEEPKIETEVAIFATEDVEDSVFKTYELICLDKLKELGRSTAAEWSYAMGYQHHSSLAKVIKRIQEKYPDKLIVVSQRKPRLYEAA